MVVGSDHSNYGVDEYVDDPDARLCIGAVHLHFVLMRHLKRWLTIAIITFCFFLFAGLAIILTMDESIDNGIAELKWLAPGDWRKMRGIFLISAVLSWIFFWWKSLLL